MYNNREREREREKKTRQQKPSSREEGKQIGSIQRVESCESVPFSPPPFAMDADANADADADADADALPSAFPV